MGRVNAAILLSSTHPLPSEYGDAAPQDFWRGAVTERPRDGRGGGTSNPLDTTLGAIASALEDRKTRQALAVAACAVIVATSTAVVLWARGCSRGGQETPPTVDPPKVDHQIAVGLRGGGEGKGAPKKGGTKSSGKHPKSTRNTIEKPDAGSTRLISGVAAAMPADALRERDRVDQVDEGTQEMSKSNNKHDGSTSTRNTDRAEPINRRTRSQKKAERDLAGDRFPSSCR